MKDNQEQEKTDASSKSKKDTNKERLIELKNTYVQMIKLRKENLDTFKKIDMSKKIYMINKLFYLNSGF